MTHDINLGDAGCYPSNIIMIITLISQPNIGEMLTKGRKIPMGQSNSLIENKLTTPRLKNEKDKETNNSTHNTDN